MNIERRELDSPSCVSPSCFDRLLLAEGPEEAKDDSPKRETLVKKLTFQLEQADDDASFKLSARELRLILGLPSASFKPTGIPDPVENLPEISDASFGTIPDPVETLPEMSDVFDAWDFEPTEDLTPDEVQAIMIALTAFEQQTNKQDKAPTLPMREVSVKQLGEGPQFMVTLLCESLDGFAEEKEDVEHTPQEHPLSNRRASVQSLPVRERSFIISLPGGLTEGQDKPPGKPARRVTLQRRSQPALRTSKVHGRFFRRPMSFDSATIYEKQKSMAGFPNCLEGLPKSKDKLVQQKANLNGVELAQKEKDPDRVS